MHAINSTWEKIRARLESERIRIHAEITQYPMPIPACDAHFNHLLEERARITDELNRLQAIAGKSGTSEDSIKQIEEFIRTSGYVGDDLRQATASRNT